MEEFFSENKLPVVKSDIPTIKVLLLSMFPYSQSGHMIPSSVVQGSRYSTPDGRLTIFACDLFDITSELVGDVDAVWDRGSFVALSFEARPRYVTLLKSLVGKSFRWVSLRSDWITFLDSGTFCKLGSTTKPFTLARHTGQNTLAKNQVCSNQKI